MYDDESRCVKIFTDMLTYTDAAKRCEQDNGMLAIVSNQFIIVIVVIWNGMRSPALSTMVMVTA